jgi:hypothetical protein
VEGRAAVGWRADGGGEVEGQAAALWRAGDGELGGGGVVEGRRRRRSWGWRPRGRRQGWSSVAMLGAASTGATSMDCVSLLRLEKL